MDLALPARQRRLRGVRGRRATGAGPRRFVLLAVLAGTAGPAGPDRLALSAVFALNGLGMGAAFSPVMSVALTDVPAVDAANVSGLLTTVLQLAQAFGVAGLGSLYLSLVAGGCASAVGRSVRRS